MRWALHLVLHLHPSLHLHTVAFPLDAPFSLAVCLPVCLSCPSGCSPLSMPGVRV